MIPADCVPAADEAVVEVHAGPDNYNRYRFSAYWPDDATPSGTRGQEFHANLDDHLTEWDRQERRVRMVWRTKADAEATA